MSFLDPFLVFWLRRARYPWSRLRRKLFEGKFLKTQLPSPGSLQDIVNALPQVDWTMDGPLHLYDTVSYPQTVWNKKKDDRDGFAVLAAELLNRWHTSSDPVLLTVLMRPVRYSHTVCVFRNGDNLRFFDNENLND